MGSLLRRLSVPPQLCVQAPDASVIAEIGGKERFNNTVIASLLETAMKHVSPPSWLCLFLFWRGNTLPHRDAWDVPHGQGEESSMCKDWVTGSPL